jgi:hypothetical protein
MLSNCDSTDGAFGGEAFFGIPIVDMAAVIHHTSELPSSPGGWSVVWYDPEADVTYQFSALACLYDECVGRNLAAEFGPNTFSPDNWTAAIAVAQHVSSFEAVRLR